MENSIDWLAWFQEQWIILSPILLSLVLRLLPTKKNWDIVSMLVKFIFKQLDKRVPNIKKGGGKHLIILLVVGFSLVSSFSSRSFAQTNGYFNTVFSKSFVPYVDRYGVEYPLVLYPDSNAGMFINEGGIDYTFPEYVGDYVTSIGDTSFVKLPIGGISNSLLTTDGAGGVNGNDYIRFDNSGNGLEYSGNGVFSPNNGSYYYRFDEIFRIRNNTTDGSGVYSYFDIKDDNINLNIRSSSNSVDFESVYNTSYLLKRAYNSAFSAIDDIGFLWAVYADRFELQSGGDLIAPGSGIVEFFIDKDSAYFNNKTIVNDTIKTTEGVEFADGTVQTTAASGGASGTLFHDIYSFKTVNDTRDTLLAFTLDTTLIDSNKVLTIEVYGQINGTITTAPEIDVELAGDNIDVGLAGMSNGDAIICKFRVSRNSDGTWSNFMYSLNGTTYSQTERGTAPLSTPTNPIQIYLSANAPSGSADLDIYEVNAGIY